MNTSTLFNVNGSIGSGAYETPDYPTVHDFLHHLDYLGVDRSLVWHVEARDFNPTLGNRRLLTEIADSDAQERLFPAFVVTPTCYFEYRALDFLRASFEANQVRALRIMPNVSRFTPRHLERVLAALAEFEPLVLWDVDVFHDEEDIHGIEYLAKKMPQVHFAITQKMWQGFGSVLDLMWRCPNVYVDISWLHMRDTIELLRDHFGAERLLFGIGYKSHYGAALAMLAHAQISEEERELISHGNLERLLKLPASPPKSVITNSSNREKPLWSTFKSGKPIDGIKIIDAHGHDGPHARGWFLREGTLEAKIKQMDRLGVDKLILSAERALFANPLEGNLELEAIAQPYQDRIAGYLAFNPRYAEKLCPHFDDFFAGTRKDTAGPRPDRTRQSNVPQGNFFVGFKILPSYWKIPLPDASYQVVWEYANEHHLPILIHTWDDKYNSPALLTEIAKHYPNAKFLLGHSGGGTKGRVEAEALALVNDNVYLEFCGTFTTPMPFEDSANRVGWDKVLFGSDTGAHCQAWELGRYLSMPVADEVLMPGLAENMERILAAAR